MIEAYDLSFNLTAYIKPILIEGLECGQNFSFYVLHRSGPSGANMTDLNKNSTLSIDTMALKSYAESQCVHPSRASIC